MTPRHSQSQGWVVIVLTKERDLAIAAIEHALSLNPSCATAHYFAALVNSFAQNPAAAAFHAKQALRLSPFDPSAFEAHLAMGMAAVGELHFEEAASHFAKASQINPRHSLFPFMHAIALALAGRTEEATSSLRRGLELEPSFGSASSPSSAWLSRSPAKFIEGARLLGLPE
jgi:tetratricopeptide (TPR) repeat protein